MIDEDRLTHNGERIHKRYYQRSGGGGKSITVCSFIRLAFLGIRSRHYKLEAAGFVLIGSKLHINPAGRLQEAGADRQTRTVDNVLAGAAGYAVIEIEAHTLDDLTHKVR